MLACTIIFVKGSSVLKDYGAYKNLQALITRSVYDSHSIDRMSRPRQTNLSVGLQVLSHPAPCRCQGVHA